jgi:hypothetical protein
MLATALAGMQCAAAFDDSETAPAQSVLVKARQSTARACADALEKERFVERLLAQLDVEEKVGQMIQADIASITGTSWVPSSPGAMRRPATTFVARRRHGWT